MTWSGDNQVDLVKISEGAGEIKEFSPISFESGYYTKRQIDIIQRGVKEI